MKTPSYASGFVWLPILITLGLLVIGGGAAYMLLQQPTSDVGVEQLQQEVQTQTQTQTHTQSQNTQEQEQTSAPTPRSQTGPLSFNASSSSGGAVTPDPEPMTVHFSAGFPDTAQSLMGKATYKVDFGDGASGTLVPHSCEGGGCFELTTWHTYSAPGTYTAKLSETYNGKTTVTNTAVVNVTASQATSPSYPATVLSPKSGDSWSIGNTYTMQFESSAPWPSDITDVVLVKPDGTNVGIVSSSKFNTDWKFEPTQQWTIGQLYSCLGAGCPGHEITVVPGSYRLELFNGGTGNVFAESDVFTIVAAK